MHFMMVAHSNIRLYIHCGPLVLRVYKWTWIWRTQWDQENWSVICKIRHIHMTNTRYASDWDQAYRPSYAKIRRTVVRHIQVHLYIPWSVVLCLCFSELCMLGSEWAGADAGVRQLRRLHLHTEQHRRRYLGLQENQQRTYGQSASKSWIVSHT